MNSLPLSESMPSKSKGKSWRMASIAAQTASWLRLGKAIGSVQPVHRSVQVKVYKNWPATLSPQCATKSTSRKPGLSSLQSAKMRTGMFFLSKLPGLVVLRPCGLLKRAGARQRSMLERLMRKSNSLVSAEHVSSPQRSKTLIPSGRSVHRFPRFAPALPPLRRDRWLSALWSCAERDDACNRALESEWHTYGDSLWW